MTREELWLAAIAGVAGANPPDYPVWHYEQMLAAIYDAVTGAASPRPFPERSWHLDEVLYAVYCAAAGLDDPGCPEPTCRIEQFWKGVYDAATGGDSASVPDPVWRIEEFLAGVFDVASGWGASLLTETGNAPLTLANAIARAIKSLTQTGLCDQADTPTPSNPVDIVCNNGALTMVDDELPSGYKRVKGFSVDDDCYWKFTGFKLNGSDTLRFSFSCTASCNVIGAYSGSATGNNYSLYVATGGGNYLRYKSGAYNSGIDANTRYDVTITPTGSTGMKTNSTWTELEFTSTTDFCVGTTSTSTTSAKLKGSLFGNVIVDGRMTLVPCERLSDNVLGYYDLVGEAFHAPTTGTPTSLGYDGSHYALQTVGTAEVLTVQSKNLCTFDGFTVEGTSQGIVVPGYDISFIAEGTVFEPNTRYTISAYVTQEDVTTSASGSLLIFYVDYSDGTSASFGITTESPSRAYWVTAANKTVTNVRRWIKAARWTGGTITVSNMQIEIGITPTDYEPYHAAQNASVVNLLSVGSYADTQEIIGGAVTRACGITILTGEESGWALSDSGTTHRFRGTKPDDCYTPSGRAPILSSHFVYVATGQGQGGAFVGASQYWYFIPTDQTIDTADKWKAWLKAQYDAGTPVIVIYPLATETTESVAGQSLSTAAGTNVVSVTAEVSPIALTCEYYGSGS